MRFQTCVYQTFVVCVPGTRRRRERKKPQQYSNRKISFCVCEGISTHNFRNANMHWIVGFLIYMHFNTRRWYAHFMVFSSLSFCRVRLLRKTFCSFPLVCLQIIIVVVYFFCASFAIHCHFWANIEIFTDSIIFCCAFSSFFLLFSIFPFLCWCFG